MSNAVRIDWRLAGHFLENLAPGSCISLQTSTRDPSGTGSARNPDCGMLNGWRLISRAPNGALRRRK
jgi:hypothetical protein